ncbi:MAG: glycosyltransferase family 2 protein [Methanobacterium sp.]
MTPRISVIILNWNGWEDTVECLESLYRVDCPCLDVVVVDNASEDESLVKIREFCKGDLVVESPFFTYDPHNKPINITELTEEQIRVNKSLKEEHNLVKSDQIPAAQNELTLIKNHKNHGFADGNNIGIIFALENLNPEYVLLLNNDTVVDENFIAEMVRVAEEEKEIGFVGSKTYFYDDKNVLQAAGGGYIDLEKGESLEVGFGELDNGQHDRPYELDYVGGSCLLVKKRVIKDIGLLDSNYFMYWEDVDWCFTGIEHGYKSLYAFKSRIWHKYGTSSENYLKTFYHNRNRLYFTRKHADKGLYRKFLKHFLKDVIQESGYQLIYQRNWVMFKALISGTVQGFKLKLDY